MSDYTHQFTQLENVLLHHLEWPGGDPPVVYLPGFIATGFGALRLAAAVAPLRRVLALDLRGRGQSDKPPGEYGITTHLDDLRAWLAALNISRLVLAGHSFGAIISLTFAAQHPEMVERIILFDGGMPPSELAFQMFHAYHQNLTYQYESLEAYIAPYRSLITLQPWTDEAEQLVRANVIQQPDGSVQRAVPQHVVLAELEQLERDQRRDQTPDFRTISVPILLIRAGLGSIGKADQHITDAALENMRDVFPQLQVFEMPDTGHTGILTVPDEKRDNVLRQFVSSTGAP